ncbi:MAG: putative 4-hydroxybenzoate polyprenyltransferase [Spirochaetes bacterium]|jgi:4-hydroxybenzoate polyprenyltransferase|nr:putative 4-hydroxybenzoate polyprenyltransferase [Spirochaetota bacterium]
MNTAFKKFAGLIMIEQTLFALPFAYLGVLFAGGGGWDVWIWVTVALFSARTAGMSFNRVLDAEYDAKNERTAGRHIPRGEVSGGAVWAIAAVCTALLVFSSYMLNELCFYLSFAAAALLFTYSLFKRFSSGSHFYLGLAEAAAPIGGYLAVSGRFEFGLVFPGLAILFWIAGLDILYAVQDIDFDRSEGLYSIPARLGPAGSLAVSSASYALAAASLAAAGIVSEMTFPYWISMIAVSGIFFRQQWIARTEIGNIREAILKVFSINRLVSPVLLAGAVCDHLAKRFGPMF